RSAAAEVARFGWDVDALARHVAAMESGGRVSARERAAYESSDERRLGHNCVRWKALGAYAELVKMMSEGQVMQFCLEANVVF
ncbi:MAG: hypothetical protein INR71_07500, partial [Terriglobus roseus]|nr:hypothetical protein [Terriglobus roseus]